MNDMGSGLSIDLILAALPLGRPGEIPVPERVPASVLGA